MAGRTAAASRGEPRPGDRIVMRAKTKRLAPAARQGEILEIVDPSQPRYLVRWDDGRETLIAPLPDSVRIEPARPKRARATRTSAAGSTSGATRKRKR